MGLRIALAFAVAVANLSSCAAGPAPEREARGSAIVSAREPAVRIEVPREARYVGADRFVLLGIADCELHVFVEADAQHRVQRLYWIQFEGYLPSRPDLHHRYESPRHETVAGMDFYVDTWVSPETPRDFEPDSDVAHLRRLLAAKSLSEKTNATTMFLPGSCAVPTGGSSTRTRSTTTAIRRFKRLGYG